MSDDTKQQLILITGLVVVALGFMLFLAVVSVNWQNADYKVRIACISEGGEIYRGKCQMERS